MIKCFGMTHFDLTFFLVRLLDTLEKVGYTCTKFILRNNFTLCSIDLFDLFDHLPTHVATRCRHVEHKKNLSGKIPIFDYTATKYGGGLVHVSLSHLPNFPSML